MTENFDKYILTQEDIRLSLAQDKSVYSEATKGRKMIQSRLTMLPSGLRLEETKTWSVDIVSLDLRHI